MFFKERLRQARELCGLRQSQLAHNVRKSQGTVANIESGISQPSGQLLAQLAKATGFPVSFFSTPPIVNFPTEEMMFRARASTSRREAVAACRFAEVVYELMARIFENYVEQLPISIQTLTGLPTLAAQKARRTMGIAPAEPVEHVTHAVEKSGILVLALPLEFEKIDAFSAWVGEETKKPVIAICKATAGDRIRWNVSHELGHLLLHSNHTQLRAEQHREADQFAAEFLLPEIAMREQLTPPVTLSSVAALKPKWGVSMQALVRRAFGLGIIPERQYRGLFEEISARGWRTMEPSNLDIAIERPNALRQLAEIAYGRPIDYPRLATESQLSIEMAKHIVEGYGETSSDPANARGVSRKSAKVIPLRG